MLAEFLKFLKEFNVIALAIAVVIGTAATALVNSLVKDVLLPLVAPLMFAESWKEAAWQIGPISIAYGSFLAEFLNFLILALIVFIVAKKILKIEAKK